MEDLCSGTRKQWDCRQRRVGGSELCENDADFSFRLLPSPRRHETSLLHVSGVSRLYADLPIETVGFVGYETVPQTPSIQICVSILRSLRGFVYLDFQDS